MSRVVLGVTGGIAAFKAADVLGRLRERGVAVRVAMTRAATRFVTPLTFAALSGEPVLVDDLREDAQADIPHVEWARWCRGVVVAPATADFLARAAHGLADDALTCLLLALEPDRPLVLAPAMNTQMWNNPLVQANLARLKEIATRRIVVVEPIAKRLACGEVGPGGLAPPEAIADAVVGALEASEGGGGDERDETLR